MLYKQLREITIETTFFLNNHLISVSHSNVFDYKYKVYI